MNTAIKKNLDIFKEHLEKVKTEYEKFCAEYEKASPLEKAMFADVKADFEKAIKIFSLA